MTAAATIGLYCSNCAGWGASICWGWTALGCGNGALTRELAGRGYRVLGLDASPEQLALARQTYPDLTFGEGNALDFVLEAPADAIFSNAVLHWIDADQQQAMLDHIATWFFI